MHAPPETIAVPVDLALKDRLSDLVIRLERDLRVARVLNHHVNRGAILRLALQWGLERIEAEFPPVSLALNDEPEEPPEEPPE